MDNRSVTHPDHDTLATFRRRFVDELAGLFVQVLEMAHEMKLLKLGTVSPDGTKMKANASRHGALSHGHIEQLEIQLKAEVEWSDGWGRSSHDAAPLENRGGSPQSLT